MRKALKLGERGEPCLRQFSRSATRVLSADFWLVICCAALAAWRRHRADKAVKAIFIVRLWVEISWTIVPCVIVLALIWPTVRVFWLG
jgi:heme/copper-type cytochrome/quinol oxidase subunit 2